MGKLEIESNSKMTLNSHRESSPQTCCPPPVQLDDDAAVRDRQTTFRQLYDTFCLIPFDCHKSYKP